MTFELPTPSETFEAGLDDGVKIKVRRHGNPAGLRILLTHGNGFAANAYYPYWRQLLANYDLIVFDFRNHGENIPAEPANHHYEQLSRDLERAVQAVSSKLGEKRMDARYTGIMHGTGALIDIMSLLYHQYRACILLHKFQGGKDSRRSCAHNNNVIACFHHVLINLFRFSSIAISGALCRKSCTASRTREKCASPAKSCCHR